MARDFPGSRGIGLRGLAAGPTRRAVMADAGGPDARSRPVRSCGCRGSTAANDPALDAGRAAIEGQGDLLLAET